MVKERGPVEEVAERIDMVIDKSTHSAQRPELIERQTVLEMEVHEAYGPAALEAQRSDVDVQPHAEADTDMDTAWLGHLGGNKAAGETLEAASVSFSSLSRWKPQGPNPTSNLCRPVQSCGMQRSGRGCGERYFAIPRFVHEV